MTRKFAALCGLLALCTVVRAQNQCGGVQSNTSGVLQNLNYPASVVAPIHCNWTINVVGTGYVYLRINELDLGRNDTLVIFDGVSNRTYDLSDDLHDELFALLPNISWVSLNIVKDNLTDLPRRFMASYTSEKTDNRYLTISDRGIIRSPIFSERTSTIPLEFEWIITEKPGSIVHLSFKHFNISDGYLTVNDGRQHVANFSGHQLPGDIIATDNVKLSFFLKPTNVNCSFELMFEQQEFNCSRTLVINGTTNVHFESIPTQDKVKCLTIVEGPPNSVLSASLSVDSKALSYPYALLLINDGPSRYSPNLVAFPTTSRSQAPDVLSTGNQLWIEYKSDVLERTPEVNVTVYVHNSGRSLVGSGTIDLTVPLSNATLVSDSSAFILSSAAKDEQVVLTLGELNLEPDNEILLYDGATQERLLANFTKLSLRYDVPSTDNQMMVVAKKFSGNATFNASFVSAPKDCNLLSNGGFGSYHLNSIGPNTSCFWNIVPDIVNASGTIAVTINQLNVKSGMTLTLFGGLEDSANIIFNTSTNHTTAITAYSPSNSGARLLLANNGKAITDLIIDASYVLLQGCDIAVDVTNETVITNPNYPNAFPVNARCQWNVTSASPSKSLIFRMDDVHLSGAQSLIFYDINGTVIANVSGNTSVDDLIFASPVSLQWSSKESSDAVMDKGFKLVVCLIDNGGIYNGSVKNFSTPGFPKKVVNSTTSVWSIRIPETAGKVNVVSLSITHGDISDGTKYLQFYEGGSVKSVATNMSAVNSTNYLSRTNELTIEYTYVEDKIGGFPYHFTYEAFECKNLCGNKMCLHESWRCNGFNDCGDNTDELNCTAQPIIYTTSTGVPVGTLVAMIFVMFILGVVFTIAAPIVIKRIRTQGNYQEFRNTAEA